MSVPNSEAYSMFRPPVDRAMRVLDRSFFHKTIPLAAAAVFEYRQIGPCRSLLNRDLLDLERVPCVKEISDPETKTLRKVLLLKPDIRPDDSSTWGAKLHELVEQKKVVITSYDLRLEYGYWDYMDIMSSIVPEDTQNDDFPTGFTIVGHVAHLNLRDRFLPYKHLIASVLLDKNPTIKTVINKTDDVGTHSEFRTFQYELLAGDPSLNTEVKELDCTFRFDYSKVYWNSRLNTEHERLVNQFNPGEAVCDVMAGVGPFAVPAGKKKVFVWANDLNPESYASMVDAVKVNKVSDFVKPFIQDGREFIRNSAREIEDAQNTVDVTPKLKWKSRSAPPPPDTTPKEFLVQPKTFDHYVMNLPATATEFLDAFIGLYHGREHLFVPHTDRKLPMIHVHCFSTKSEDNRREGIAICEVISQKIGHVVTPDTPELSIWDVRDVAPHKRMFCASFRLPEEVAFRKP